MTTVDTGHGAHASPPGVNYLNIKSGFLSWAATLDHKRIGLMYLVSILSSFLFGGLAALAVRTELIAPGEQFLSQDQYNQMFTLHGAIMVFLVIIPSVPAALGNFVLPIMLGAKDVAFPRLNLMSYYLWITGAICFVMAIIGVPGVESMSGGIDTGWTFYTPYSTDQNSAMGGVIMAVTGAFILGFSSIFTGMNFLVTIHRLRPPGMTWFRMPLFLWSIYATAVIQVLATPVLGITLLLLAVERGLGIGIFNPALGGDPVLYQHFFWFYSHPAVYIMILPGMGIISELIAVHSHRHIFGYRFIAFSSVAIAMFGFIVWGHHMFTSGQSPLMNVVFSAITFSVSIPSAIKVFNWLATLYKGSISFNTPMLYALSFLFIFSIGGLTGLHLGTLATDIHLHDTYFVVAHFHYVMMGSALIAMIGGLHHWWPKMTGRMYNENAGRIGAILVFIGFNATFLPQFVLGSQGMPRRYADYSNMLPETVELYTTYHFWSTIGSYIMAAGFFLTAGYLLASLVTGRRAPANPWGGRSLEWQCASPPPLENFAEAPTVGDCYDFSVLEWDEAEQGYKWQEGAKRPGEQDETAVTHVEAHAHEDDHPFMQHHWETPVQQFEAGKLGMWLFLATEVLLFGGLFCGYVIWRCLHPEMFKFGSQFLDTTLGAVNTAILIASSLTMATAVTMAQRSNQRGLLICLVLTLMGAFGFLVIKYFEYTHKFHEGWYPGIAFYEKPDPTLSHTWDAELGISGVELTAVDVSVGAKSAEDLGLPADIPVEVSTVAPPAQAAGGIDTGVLDHMETVQETGGTRHTKHQHQEHITHPLQSPDRPENAHMFFNIYFMMTGLHGVHVGIGIIVITWLIIKAGRGQFNAAYFTPVDLGGLYWHVVDLIWIFLFPLFYLI